MTTWHEDEPLSEVFWFAKTLAQHASVDLVQTVILHISAVGKKDELLSLRVLHSPVESAAISNGMDSSSP